MANLYERIAQQAGVKLDMQLEPTILLPDMSLEEQYKILEIQLQWYKNRLMRGIGVVIPDGEDSERKYYSQLSQGFGIADEII